MFQLELLQKTLIIGGKSNELNSCHNTLYFVDCPQSRGTVHSGAFKHGKVGF